MWIGFLDFSLCHTKVGVQFSLHNNLGSFVVFLALPGLVFWGGVSRPHIWQNFTLTLITAFAKVKIVIVSNNDPNDRENRKLMSAVNVIL